MLLASRSGEWAEPGTGPVLGWSLGLGHDELPSPEQEVEVKRKQQVFRGQPGAQEASLIHFRLSVHFLCTVL